MKFNFKRICATLLVLCMVFSMLPVMASAATYERTITGPATIGGIGTNIEYAASYDYDAYTITITAPETAGGMDFVDWDSIVLYVDNGLSNYGIPVTMNGREMVAGSTNPLAQDMVREALPDENAFLNAAIWFLDGANYATYYDLTVDGATSTYLKGETVTLPTAPAAPEEGKYFIGWSDGTNLFVAGAAIVMDKDYVLTPYYVDKDAETYLAIFADPEGHIIDICKSDDAGYVTAPAFPASDKYNLDSWDTDLTAPLTEDTVIKATGTLKSYNISWASVEDGTATVSVASSATVGSYVSFSVNPAADYEIAAVTAKANDEFIAVSGDYGFIMPARNVIITVYTNVTTYDVTFKADDVLVAQYQLAKGTAITAPAAPEKEGYDFIGWFDAADNQLVDGTTTVAGDVEYTARYEAKEYTVSVNDGAHTTVTLDPVEGTAMHIGDLVRITVANDDGFETNYLAATAGADAVPIICDGKDSYFLHMPASDVVITVSEEASKNTVQFIVDDDLYAFEYCDSDTAPVAPAAPEKEGYTFTGWTASDGTFYADGEEFAPIYADETYTAEFTINTYDLTYYRGVEADESEYKCFLTLPDGSVVEFFNNDTTDMPTYVVPDIDFGTKVVLGEASLPGYTFQYWLDEDGNIHLAGSNFEMKGDTTLTAIWKPDTELSCFVSFNTEDGIYAGYLAYDGQDASIPEVDPVKDGYIFKGWEYDGSVYSNSGVKDFTVIADENRMMIFTAVWEEITYTVNYTGEGVTAWSDTGLSRGDYVVAEAPEREGYTFLAWEGADGAYYDAKQMIWLKSDMTFTAQWLENEAAKHTVKLYDESGNLFDILVVTDGDTIVAPYYTEGREDCTYLWECSDSPLGGTLYYAEGDAITVTADITLRAVIDEESVYNLDVLVLPAEVSAGVATTAAASYKVGQTATVTINVPTGYYLKAVNATTASGAAVVDNLAMLSENNFVYAVNMPMADVDVTVILEKIPAEAVVLNYYVNGDLYDYDVVLKGETSAPAPAPAMEGKAFAQWNGDNGAILSAGEAYTVAEEETAAQINFVAQFTDNEYTVTYLEAPYAPAAGLKYGEKYTVEAAPDKDGYEFVAWSGSDGAVYDAQESIVITGDLTLTPMWKEIIDSYAIKFYDEFNNLYEAVVVTEGNSFEAPVYVPARDGMVYSWLDSDHSVTLDAFDSYTPTSDMSFKLNIAQEGKYPVNITVLPTDAPANVAGPINPEYEYNTPVIVPITVPEGYVLKDVQAMHSGNTAVPGSLIITGDDTFNFLFTMPEGEVTVYVVLEKIPAGYTAVKFINDGDLYDYVVVQKGTSGTAPAVAPSKDGYEFVEWRNGTSYVGAGEPFAVAADADDEIVYTAIYNQLFYKVHFNLDGGLPDFADIEHVAYKDTVTLAGTPSKDGYVFIGWREDATGIVYGADANYVVYADADFTAIWEAAECIVRFVDPATGILYGYEPVSEGKQVTAPAAVVAEGKTFQYWQNKDNDADKVNANSLTPNILVDTTYNAIFEVSEHNIAVVTDRCNVELNVTGSVAVGTAVEFTVTPNADCAVESVVLTYIDGLSPVVRELYPDASGSYTFVMPDADVTITAKAVQNVFSVFTNADANTLISGNPNKAQAGETVSFTAEPNNADYVLNEVYVLTESGAPVALSIVNGEYVFTMPAEDVTITATSVKAELTVTYLDSDNTLLGIVPVDSGDYATAPVASKDGYTFDHWEILPLTDPATAFDPATDKVEESLIVRAVYVGNTFTVEAGLVDNVYALDAECTISSGNVNSSNLLLNKLNAEAGKDVYFTVAANYDYVITGVAIVGVDGSKTIIEPTLRLKETVDGINFYTVTFPMPTEDVKIDVYTVAKMFRVDVTENIPEAGDYTLNGFYTNNLMIPQGDYVTIEIAPIPGYEVVDVTGTFFDGISETSLVDYYLSADKTEFSFPMVAKDVKVSITYAPIDYTIDIETSNFETYKPDASVNPAKVVESLNPDLTSQGRIELIPATERDYTNALSQVYKIPANTTAIVNDRIYFKVVEYTGYDLDTMTVYTDGYEQTCPITKLADGSYCFDMPADDVAIVATFVEETYKVTKDVASEAHGQVELNALIENSIAVDYKDEVTVTVTPDDGYQVSKIYYVLDNTSVKDFDAASYANATVMSDALDTEQSITFHMPASDVKVYVEYIAINYTVSDDTMEAVTTYTTPHNEGDQVNFNVEANYGYTISKVYVVNDTTGERVDRFTDDINGTYGADYYFTMPASSVTIHVETVKDIYDVEYRDNGDLVGGEQIPYLETANVTDFTPLVDEGRPGYHFVGWTSKDTETPVTAPSNDNADFVIVKDTTIIAAYDKDEIDVHFLATVNGTVTELSTGNTAEYLLDTTVFGDTVKFTAEPDEGYVIDTVRVYTNNSDGYVLDLFCNVSGNEYSFVIPATFKSDIHDVQAADVIVSVTFKKDTFTLTKAADCESDGEISVNGSVATETSYEYLYQDTVTIAATPNAGYYVASIVAVNADGSVKFDQIGAVPAVDTPAGDPVTLTFAMPACDLTYKVDYEKIDYSITCVYDAAQGKAETDLTPTAQIDDIVTITVTPEPGYELAELTVTYAGGEKSCLLTEIAENVFTFTMPADAVTVTAIFTEITYIANLELIGEGDATLNGYYTDNMTADYLSTVTINVMPDAGWELTSIVVDGGAITVNEPIAKEGGDYTFTMPDHDVDIVVTLVKTEFGVDSFAVNFYEDGHGTVTLAPASIANVGDNVIITADPDDGYRVKEVVVLDAMGYAVPVSCLSVGGDPDYVETWNFTMPANDVEVYVTFEVQGSSYYYDVRTDQWYYNAVTFVTDRGYFFGVDVDLFGPYFNMNRAMFVTVLGRMSRVDTSLYTSQAFSDVDMTAYYAPYVEWAADNGIVLGRTETIFDPDANITREEMAAIMYRYCDFLGLDMTLKNQVFMDRYTDKDDISDWALEYVKWAVGVGLMRGQSPYTIDPLKYATRAEVAQVIMNLCDKVIYM